MKLGRKATVSICIILLIGHSSASSWKTAYSNENEREEVTNNIDPSPLPTEMKPKLLVIMLDGFRWDYYDLHKEHLDAFDEFLMDGVRAEWVEPTFPSVSYPAWTTISTGLHPESHGILGNYIYDQRLDSLFALFDLASTRRWGGWQDSEPIWISATRERKRVFLHHWSRCDVLFQGTAPNGECTGYRPDEGILAVRRALNITLQKLRNYDLLMVILEHIDNIGHQYGPDSAGMINALKDVNKEFKFFFDELLDKFQDLEKNLNIVILSDHGMIESGSDSNLTHVFMKDYVNPNHVIKVIESGGYVAILPFPSYHDVVYSNLQRMEGVDVYKREDIPEKFHYKNHRLVLDILVVAKPGYFINGLPNPFVPRRQGERESAFLQLKQIPPASESIPLKRGSHGFYGINEMRGIFFAKGPEFKSGVTIPGIQMVDIYQVFTRVLGIPPQPHNGTWTNVVPMFRNNAFSIIPQFPLKLAFPILITHWQLLAIPLLN